MICLIVGVRDPAAGPGRDDHFDIHHRHQYLCVSAVCGFPETSKEHAPTHLPQSSRSVPEEGEDGAAWTAESGGYTAATARPPCGGVGVDNTLGGHPSHRIPLNRFHVQLGRSVPDPHDSKRDRYFQRNYHATADWNAAVLCWVYSSPDLVSENDLI